LPLYSTEYFDGDEEDVQLLIFIYMYTHIDIGKDIERFFYISHLNPRFCAALLD